MSPFILEVWFSIEAIRTMREREREKKLVTISVGKLNLMSPWILC